MHSYKNAASLFVSALLAVGLGLGARAEASTPVSEQTRMQQQVESACWPALLSTGCTVGGLEREPLGDGVAAYRIKMRVGLGAHDVIGLSRVVRETAPWVPARSARSVFLVHGDLWGFDAAFRPLARYLAEGGVDVWGIDLRWVNVPAETTDFTFMKHWNLGTHVRDVRAGLGVARILRWFNGGEDGRMHLLGWSRGAVVAYATAGLETQLPPVLRHVKGLIPVDMAVKFGPEDGALQALACTRYQSSAAAYLGGQYEGGLLGPGQGLTVRALGQLAATDPAGVASPPLTNRQTAMTLAGATYMSFGGLEMVPYYHHIGVSFDAATQLPTALTWTQESVLYDFFQRAAPYQSFAEQMETEAMLCGTEGGAVDVPYDDHFEDITVPVLHVGAAGGFGAQGLYALSLLGSTDKTVRLVQFYPAASRSLDFGHSDLLLATDAEREVWSYILDWLNAR